MTGRDWSAEIAALAPHVRGNALDIGGANVERVPGATPVPRRGSSTSFDWGAVPDQSADCLVALGATVLRDPVSEVHHWRRVLRDGGHIALVPARPGAPLWLIGLLNHLGGFEIVEAKSIRPSPSWLLVGTRSKKAEISVPLSTAGPRMAELARGDNGCKAELYFQIGTMLLQAGDVDLSARCFSALVEIEGRTADGLLGLGMCNGSREEWQSALLHLRRAVSLSPNDERIRQWLALAEDHANGDDRHE